MSLLSQRDAVSHRASDSLRMLQRARRVLLGSSPSVQAPTPTVIKFSDVGLLYFLNEKQSLLHRVIGNTNIADSQELEPLRLLVEFLSFAVGGLIVEAERIDEAAIVVQQQINDATADLQKLDLELQFRKQRVGSTVSRVLSQHYRTRVTVPTMHASDQLDSQSAAELQELSEGIASLRKTIGDLKKRKAVVFHAQRLLHGPGTAIPSIEAEAIVADLPMLVTFRKMHHSVRDALVVLRDQEASVPAVVSLVEFVMHIEVGIGAATDDLESSIMVAKKQCVVHSHTQRDERLTALDSRNKQLSTSAIKYNEALKRGLLQDSVSQPRLTIAGGRVAAVPVSSGETDDFLNLYCS